MIGFQSFAGCLYVELLSGDVTRFIDSATKMGISLQSVSMENDLTVRFCISRSAYKRLSILARQQGSELKIISRKGLYWDALGLLNRPVFLGGMILMMFWGIFLPGRIYFVQVQGNNHVETIRIVESAANCGIRFGASRRLVRSEQVKNQLIGTLPELQWVGVNTKGCVATISVREKVMRESEAQEPEPNMIIALRDGIVLDCSASKGNLLCSVGQAVSKGDVLISGNHSVQNVDMVTGADGEIFAATQHQISVMTPDSDWRRGENESHRVIFSLQIGKNLINFFKGSGISGSSCDKMYSKYVLTLPGGFALPVALIKWNINSCRMIPEDISEIEARELLVDFASCYLEDRMIAGSIIRKEELLAQADGVYELTGEYACTEMIGRAQREQIGAYNGKTD